MKKIIFILSLFLATAQTGFGQCTPGTYNITCTANYNKTEFCAPGNFTVTGNSSFYRCDSDPAGWTFCPSATLQIRLQYWTGSTWSTISSQNISNGGSYSITTSPTETRNYRIQSVVATTGSYCGTGGATVFNSTSNLVFAHTAAVANFNINGINASPTNPYEGYSSTCTGQPLILNNTSTGNMNNPQWQFYYQECNSNGSILYGSPTGYNTWQSGWLGSTIDLKTYFGGFLGSAAAMGKFYLITLKVKNGCNTSGGSTKVGLVRINATPSAPGGVLRFNGGTAPLSNQTASINISSPNIGGAYSSSFNLASATGTMIIYKAVIDRVNCTTGAFMQNIVNPTGYKFINGSFYSGIGINAETNPTGYFGANNGANSLNNCYKLKVFFGNGCAEVVDSLFFKIIGTFKTDETIMGLDESSLGDMKIALSPNPTENILRLTIESQEATALSIQIYDISGRLVKNVSNNFYTIAGENELMIETTDLNHGIYFLKATNSNLQQSTLKFIKH